LASLAEGLVKGSAKELVNMANCHVSERRPGWWKKL